MVEMKELLNIFGLSEYGVTGFVHLSLNGCLVLELGL